jgi:hypothetical protein
MLERLAVLRLLALLLWHIRGAEAVVYRPGPALVVAEVVILPQATSGQERVLAEPVGVIRSLQPFLIFIAAGEDARQTVSPLGVYTAAAVGEIIWFPGSQANTQAQAATWARMEVYLLVVAAARKALLVAVAGVAKFAFGQLGDRHEQS